ncbi:tbcc domain-containing protein 1 [Phtheirospermum japonicum]|uniref:TBCC domain-containing protein 1 n=1 Tax=Phtheirospermum japonicum TaxID=374723 RepID=A0A830AZ30_9LAMI|nr:tbcc domain-containing protein 1 [Phtheirospermum japonicum]
MSDSTAAVQQAEPAPPSTPAPAAYHLYPRREPFEHGLLPIPKLIFSDGTQTLSQLKSTLLSSNSTERLSSDALARALQVPIEHARLLIETISSVLHDESDPLVKAGFSNEIDAIGVHVYDLLVFLYIQNYKRLLPKGHRDSAAVADVWPSTSAFDGFLSALSPLQVLSMDKFEHLGFLLYFGEKGSVRIPLSQSTPFFANSDPDMPAAPVPASQVLEWLLQNISSTLEHIADRVSPKDSSPSSSSDQDVQMTDAGMSSVKPSSGPRGPSFIEGISKSSCVKQASDLKGTSAKVVNCHESVIYILAPLRYVTVYGCSDATIVIGAVGKAIRVEHCERVHLITAARRICIANCRECVFFLGVNQRPLIVGDNHKLQVAPYNAFYSQLEEHMNQVGVDPSINKWDEPMALGLVDPHDSLSHPAGVSDIQAESATRIDPDQYTDFVFPNWLEGEQTGATKHNPFPLPDAYLASQQKNIKSLEEVKQILRETQLEDSRKRELSNALHACFKDWLYGNFFYET